MAKKVKMKKSAKIGISALAILLCVVLVIVFTRPKKNDAGVNDLSQSNTESSTGTSTSDPSAENSDIGTQEEYTESEAQLIESEGDIEIIIPDDQGSDGF